MKLFEILDEELGISVGVLLYYEKQNTILIELQEYLDEWTAPLLFTSFVKQGVYSIPRDISYLWVKERVIPCGRQNINAILKNHRIDSYDEMKFLELSRGRCSQDSMYIRPLDELPFYVMERSIKNLKECAVIGESTLLCFFADGTTRKIDIKDLSRLEGVDKILKNRALFESCCIGPGGYFMTFDDAIDIGRDELYGAGVEIPISMEEMTLFFRNNVFDTSACCDMLECTRQNLRYLLRKQEISPIKENVKGNLYYKGDVLKTRW
ncbi:MAG: DUF2442 domain-containing protein [Butyrivibrio sp.]|nr:DUF2442 domain-containing protein [Butyrivibrio sp.]